MDAFIKTIVLVAAYSQYQAAADAAGQGNSKRKLAEMEHAYAEFRTAKLALNTP